jgi:acetyltransferase-like isoleucine patch superfamily enzyme
MRFFWSLIFYLRIKIRKGSDIAGFPQVNGHVRIYGDGFVRIGKNFRINSNFNSNPIGGDTFSAFWLRAPGLLFIGNDVGISNTTIVCWCGVIIGDNTLIGGNCKVYDTNFHSLDPEIRLNPILDQEKAKREMVCLGSGSFIGGSSILLPGSVIGNRCVIGAGARVRGLIPENTIFYN